VAGLVDEEVGQAGSIDGPPARTRENIWKRAIAKPSSTSTGTTAAARRPRREAHSRYLGASGGRAAGFNTGGPSSRGLGRARHPNVKVVGAAPIP